MNDVFSFFVDMCIENFSSYVGDKLIYVWFDLTDMHIVTYK